MEGFKQVMYQSCIWLRGRQLGWDTGGCRTASQQTC